MCLTLWMPVRSEFEPDPRLTLISGARNFNSQYSVLVGPENGLKHRFSVNMQDVNLSREKNTQCVEFMLSVYHQFVSFIPNQLQ